MASSLALLARRLVSSSDTYVLRSSGSHVHRINGYSLLQQASRPGEAVTSKPFHVGGRKFQLLLYPNGIDAGHRGFVSADLRLAYDDYNDFFLPQRWHKATAKYRVSILDDAGNLALSRIVGPCRFLTPGYRRIFDQREVEGEEIIKRKTSVDELVAVDELRRSVQLILGNDDCLKVQCDVSVVETADSKWWGNGWFMRLERAFHDLDL